MTRISYLLATMVMAAGVLADTGKQLPAETPRIGAETSQGCFKSQGDLEDKGGYLSTAVSSGMCKDVARKAKALVFALKGDKCLLGDTYPPEDDLVDDEKCNFGCPAYTQEACGGLKGGSYYSVFNTGIELDVKYMEPEETSETSSATPEETKKSEDEEEEEKDSGSSVNVAGIAAGTVVAVVAIAGAIGGVWFYMRRKRNQEIEEEHRRNAAVNSFISGGHSSGGSVTDARLDPIMAQRRMSDGSIADNEDYSRRILRVTNV